MFSAFGPARGCGDLQRECALEISDRFAGRDRLNKIRDINNDHVHGLLQHDCGQLGITVSREPEALPAKVLKQPVILYGSNREATVNNGEWNNERSFSSSAALSSFAVLEFCNPSKKDQIAHNAVLRLLETLGRCNAAVEGLGGMQSDNFREPLVKQVTEVTSVVDLGDREFSVGAHGSLTVQRWNEAIDRARSFFLGRPLALVRNDLIFFRKAYVSSLGIHGDNGNIETYSLVECLVLPQDSRIGSGKVELIVPSDKKWDTHLVWGNPGTPETKYPARVMYQVKKKAELVDPFDVQFIDGRVFVMSTEVEKDDIVTVFDGASKRGLP